MESGLAGACVSRDEVPDLSSYEIISVYINGGFGEDAALKELLEREFAARRLPLPQAGTPPSAGPVPAARHMSRETFLSYLLLIYTMTGLVYAWLYLPMRLLRGDFRKDTRHHLIQTGIAAAYQAVEVATVCFLSEFV